MDGSTSLPMVIQVDGSTSLTEFANKFYLYDSTGSGPTLKNCGVDVVAGDFGTWAPIGAVQTANGYDVAWKVPGADEYTVWSTDSNGNYIASLTGYSVRELIIRWKHLKPRSTRTSTATERW